MLVATPAKARTATATTPTPIGCKLLKINRLAAESAFADPAAFREGAHSTEQKLSVNTFDELIFR
jgi:hypothetical protein